MNKERCLLVVSGPSGVGKGTVVARLRALHPEIEFSVSATTRAPRAGERDGVDYHFISREQFEQNIEQGKMLEYTEYCGRFYGTPRSEIDRRIAEGVTVVLDIEVEGAANVKRLYPECTLIFLKPPSMEALRARLRGRGTETEEVIERRLKRAEEELALADQYDFTVINSEVDACAEEIYAILRKRQNS